MPNCPTEDIILSLKEIDHNGLRPEVLTDGDALYEIKRQVFNRKFHFKPTAIVCCECTEHVQQVMQLANKLDFDIRVRSGGHDHEGECSGTDTVLIDLSKMKKAVIEKELGQIRVQPGLTFKELIPQLIRQDVCIPHGACSGVGIAGFILGGGWGPWTRKYGMCCESLIGATIVLGDGQIVMLMPGSPPLDLLWALRGGGGMSYGIVTELIIKTFEIGKERIKFQVEWDHTPAYRVLQLWEDLISPDKNTELVGANLKILATPKSNQTEDEAVHKCILYGFYEGTEISLIGNMERWFKELLPVKISIPVDTGDTNYMEGFEPWDRISTIQEMMKTNSADPALVNQVPLDPLKPLDREKIPADISGPAAHKITSRVVAEKGWDDEGRKILIRSLESDLIPNEEDKTGIYCYVTLAAISGPYYQQVANPEDSAFPYKRRPFMIQYQAWWNQNDQAGTAFNVGGHINRAEDWIAACRNLDFPQTDGSFINFKDEAVPTREYFKQHYEQLKTIKETYSKDPQNRLRTRKTIV
jgi:hypothetical protein